MANPAGVTQLLALWRSGDQEALHQLMPQVYRELRRLAKYYLRQERPDHTLQATALVHEAFLRLVGETQISWQNRAHFFGIAATRMRQVLVEHARSRQAAKRGGDECRISLSEADRPSQPQDVDVLVLDHALQKLEKLDAEKVRLVSCGISAD